MIISTWISLSLIFVKATGATLLILINIDFGLKQFHSWIRRLLPSHGQYSIIGSLFLVHLRTSPLIKVAYLGRPAQSPSGSETRPHGTLPPLGQRNGGMDASDPQSYLKMGSHDSLAPKLARILLKLRTTFKKDLQASPAEMVFNSSLCISGEFIAPQIKSVSDLHSLFRAIHRMPASRHQNHLSSSSPLANTFSAASMPSRSR